MPPTAWPRRLLKQISSKKRYLNGPKSRCQCCTASRRRPVPDAVIGSNTSTLPIGDLAAGLEHPERFLGVHFSNPAPFIPGVELIAHSGTDENVIEAVEALVPRDGQADGPGSTTRPASCSTGCNTCCSGKRSTSSRRAWRRRRTWTSSSAPPSATGCRSSVLSPSPTWPGLDVYRDGFRTLQAHYGERLAAPTMLTELVEAGRYGVKQGGGFVTPAGDQAPLVAYRNTAYARLGQLLTELGPAPRITDPVIGEKRPMINCSVHRGGPGRSRPPCCRLGARTPGAGPFTTPSRRNGPSTCGWCGGSASPKSTPPTPGSGSPISVRSGLRDFKSVLSDVGLTIPAISTSRRSVMDPEHGEEYLAYSHRLLDKAAELGVPMVSFGFFQEFTAEQKQALWFWLADGWHDDESPEVRGRAAALIRELAEHAASNGQQITLEMYEDTYVGTCDGAVQFLKEVGHDACGLNPDIGNFIRLHRPIEPVQDMLDKVLPYANYWHVKNYLRDEDPKTGQVMTFPVPMEFGLINYRAAISQALDLGFRGAFLCEHYGSDAITVIGKNYAYVRDILATLID